MKRRTIRVNEKLKVRGEKAEHRRGLFQSVANEVGLLWTLLSDFGHRDLVLSPSKEEQTTSVPDGNASVQKQTLLTLVLFTSHLLSSFSLGLKLEILEQCHAGRFRRTKYKSSLSTRALVFLSSFLSEHSFHHAVTLLWCESGMSPNHRVIRRVLEGE